MKSKKMWGHKYFCVILKIMNSIAIYKILNRIPDTSEAEARDVANSIAHVNDVATKADLAEIKTELKSDIVELRTELKSDIAELRTELKSDNTELRTKLKAEIVQSETNLRTELKAEIAILRTELIKWMLVFSSIIIAAVGLFNKF